MRNVLKGPLAWPERTIINYSIGTREAGLHDAVDELA
jgi:hypothetical protein